MTAIYFSPGGAIMSLPFALPLGLGVIGDPGQTISLTHYGNWLVPLSILVAIRGLLAVWHMIVGVGLLRLKPWARGQGILLAALGCMAWPAGTFLSIPALAYLLRKDLVRLFERGEGPATLSEAEAHRMEKTMGLRPA